MTATVPSVDIKGTGARIDTLRKQAVRDVQDILGLGSVQAIYKWIAGKSLPTIDNLIILSAIWDVSLDDIIVRC